MGAALWYLVVSFRAFSRELPSWRLPNSISLQFLHSGTFRTYCEFSNNNVDASWLNAVEIYISAYERVASCTSAAFLILLRMWLGLHSREKSGRERRAGSRACFLTRILVWQGVAKLSANKSSALFLKQISQRSFFFRCARAAKSTFLVRWRKCWRVCCPVWIGANAACVSLPTKKKACNILELFVTGIRYISYAACNRNPERKLLHIFVSNFRMTTLMAGCSDGTYGANHGAKKQQTAWRRGFWFFLSFHIDLFRSFSLLSFSICLFSSLNIPIIHISMPSVWPS